MFKKCHCIFISMIYCLLVSLFINATYVEATTVSDSKKTEAVIGFYEDGSTGMVEEELNDSKHLPQTGSSNNINLVLNGSVLVVLSFIIKKKMKEGN